MVELEVRKRLSDIQASIIYGYDSLDDEILWGIVINHLPKLEEEVKSLLQAE
ncbi:MAG: DUF86 domain-containing protein [Muribaculaceae bacterium]|nr:DUF86 domain-containing protein [Muribaculaceae bacterium]